MRGEEARGIAVSIIVDDLHIRLVSGEELIGDWDISQIGITALNEGFNIRAEGEEFVLHTDNDAAVADSLGLATASPRMARLVAASHPPEERVPEPEPELPRSQLGAIGFALGGVLVLVGGVVLRIAQGGDQTVGSVDDGGPVWMAYVVGGVLMVANGYLLAIGPKWARAAAFVTMATLVAVFVITAQGSPPAVDLIFPYGFVAGGLVVGVAMLFSGTISPRN